jgi:cytochrome c556
MTRLPGLLLLLITLVLAISVLVQAEEEPNDPAQKQSYWMKKKLEWSQAILRDLATGDWEKMRQNARSLRTLSKIEGRFRRVDQEEYRAQLAVFDQANSELLQAAEKENIDRATLAYMHLIHSCTNCHKILPKEPASIK